MNTNLSRPNSPRNAKSLFAAAAVVVLLSPLRTARNEG
jgi:hypothetical protein